MNDPEVIKRSVFVAETCPMRTDILSLACGPGFPMPFGHHDVFWLMHLAQENEGKYPAWCRQRAIKVLRQQITEDAEKTKMLQELMKEDQ